MNEKEKKELKEHVKPPDPLAMGNKWRNMSEEEKAAEIAKVKKNAVPPAIKPLLGRPEKVKVEGEDHLETQEVPRVVSWRKIKLWIRDRSSKHGNIIEVRILTVSNTTQRKIAKVFKLDNDVSKENVKEVVFKGFKCCFCNKSWQLNEQWELEEVTEKPTFEKFNILCGRCWGKKRVA
jgi:hypothetical protein